MKEAKTTETTRDTSWMLRPQRSFPSCSCCLEGCWEEGGVWPPDQAPNSMCVGTATRHRVFSRAAALSHAFSTSSQRCSLGSSAHPRCPSTVRGAWEKVVS